MTYWLNIKIKYKLLIDFKKLDKVGLNQNKIEDICVFEKVDLKELREVYLEGNKISDIRLFEKVHFKRLKDLGTF